MAVDESRGTQERWAEGTPIVDPALAASVYDLWSEAVALSEEAPMGEPPADVATAELMLREASSVLIGIIESAYGAPDPMARQARAGSLLAALSSLMGDVRDASFSWRVRAFAEVQTALARLRSVTTISQMVQIAPTELCRCGFDRAMFTRVDGSVGTPEAFAIVGDPDQAAEILRVGRANPMQLDHLLHETEMVRRRAPILVTDAQNDGRIHRELAKATRSRSYLAAPVMPQGRVIGFLHADCYQSRRMVGEFDRDLLTMYAEGFAYAYERTVLLERLKVLRQEVRRSKHSILAVMDEFCDAEVEVERFTRDASVGRSAASMFVPTDSRVESLLTKRELDVIRLMAMGETNAGIATKLVVSEGTVKSHVKHILRKLRASNRAEAVSRFIKLTQERPG